MAKVRVYELAREIGVESKAVMAKLQEMGEFVRSASSTIEAPVVRRLREEFPAPEQPAENGAASASKSSRQKSSGGKKATGERSAETADAQTTGQGVGQPSELPAEPAAEQADSPAAGGDGASADAEAGGTSRPKPAPPSRPEPARPRPAPGPRPGNNPFASSSTGMGATKPQPPTREGQQGQQGRSRSGGAGRGGASGQDQGSGQASSRPGGPRPSPSMMPSRPASDRPAGPGGGRSGGGSAGRAGTAGSRPAGARPEGGRSGAPAGRGAPGRGAPSSGPPSTGAGAGTGAGARGRPGGGRGRGGTQGAFGRPGGRPSRGRKSRKQRRQEFDSGQSTPAVGGVRLPRGNGQSVRLPRGSSLTDLADRINVNPASLVQALFHLGEMVTATQSVSDETLRLLGAELDYEIQVVSPEDEDRELLESFDLEFGEHKADEAERVARPPVVSVMGHVDHGKTKLLDAVRHTNVVGGEAGGITQHIGAYQARAGDEGRAITFIDTPGHEAFTAMRARGAQVTDIVVLVVAADDGVKPQTVEALNHAQAAEVPIVVAVNKVDKEGAGPRRVRGELSEYGLVPEEYGGQVLFVDLSALQETGVEGLLEAILLTADAELDLRANPDQEAQGVAIEAHLDRGRGTVATMLVQRGTLRVGDSLVAGDAHGRVRAMLDEHGQHVKEAEPSRPVQVLGLTSVPRAGDSFIVPREGRVARQIAERREARERNAALAQSRGRRTLEELFKDLETGEKQELSLVVKGDVSGSVEALEDALTKIDVGEEVSLRVLHRGVGAITENDVNLAVTSDATIIGFNVRPESKAREMAEREGVDIRYYTVIYQAIDEVEAALRGLLKPIYEEAQLGTAEVREVYKVPRIGNVAGCLVRSGTITRNSKARVLRQGVVVGDNLTVQSLKRYKDDATEVRDGYECGIGLGSSYNDLRVDDVIETFEIREKPRA